MSLSSEWFRHLPEKDQKEFEDLVRNSRQVLGRLLQIIDEKSRTIEKWEEAPSSYDSGYPHAQAFMNGKRSGLKEIRRLLEFLDQEKPRKS